MVAPWNDVPSARGHARRRLELEEDAAALGDVDAALRARRHLPRAVSAEQ
eukprot:CAMPEP_0197607818 /NCGR_PEP_ID=MMETSP1326-20131121/47853_1 /TAXON_ID=1155430 /ORGANISM="Genus nov. species nov., Strain RCC2288" /LENGTH=49 /DNA_ID= /DNA_START= /DNA_END= /DNA_ORIENTATION=